MTTSEQLDDTIDSIILSLTGEQNYHLVLLIHHLLQSQSTVGAIPLAQPSNGVSNHGQDLGYSSLFESDVLVDDNGIVESKIWRQIALALNCDDQWKKLVEKATRLKEGGSGDIRTAFTFPVVASEDGHTGHTAHTATGEMMKIVTGENAPVVLECLASEADFAALTDTLKAVRIEIDELLRADDLDTYLASVLQNITATTKEAYTRVLNNIAAIIGKIAEAGISDNTATADTTVTVNGESRDIKSGNYLPAAQNYIFLRTAASQLRQLGARLNFNGSGTETWNKWSDEVGLNFEIKTEKSAINLQKLAYVFFKCWAAMLVQNSGTQLLEIRDPKKMEKYKTDTFPVVVQNT